MPPPTIAPGPPFGSQGEIAVNITGTGPAVSGHRADLLSSGVVLGFLVGESPGWTGAGSVGVYGASSEGVAVLGISTASDGVQGRSSDAAHAGVAGVNDNGIAVYGRGKPAARFDGELVVNGPATVNGNLTIGSGVTLSSVTARKSSSAWIL